MNLAISNIAWQKNEDPTVYALLRELGITKLEIAPSRFFDKPYDQPVQILQAMRTRVEQAGLSIVALQSLLFGRPDLKLFETQAQRQELADYLKKSLVFARQMGATCLVFGSPKNRLIGSLAPEAADEIALAFFHSLGDAAVENEVLLCLEANPKEYGADFLFKTATTLEFVKNLNHPGVRLNLDLGTMTLNNEPYDYIKTCVPWIGHLHISEPFLQSVPQATTPHAAVAAIVRASGYAQTCSVEMKSVSETDNLATLRNTLTQIKQIYG